MAGKFAVKTAVGVAERQTRPIERLHVGRRQELPAFALLLLHHRPRSLAVDEKQSRRGVATHDEECGVFQAGARVDLSDKLPPAANARQRIGGAE